jgi:hypothetical protein
MRYRPRFIIILLLLFSGVVNAGEVARFPLDPSLAGAKPKFVVSPGGRNVLLMEESKYYHPKIQVNERCLGEVYGQVKYAFTPDGREYAVLFQKEHHGGFWRSLFGSDMVPFIYSGGRVRGPYQQVYGPWYFPSMKGIVFRVRETGMGRGELVQAGDRIIRQGTREWNSTIGEIDRELRRREDGKGRRGSVPFADENGHCPRFQGKLLGPCSEAPVMRYDDGKRFLVTCGSGGKVHIVQDGKVFGPYDSLYREGDIGRFEPVVAYENGGKVYALIDGISYGPYKDIWAMNYCKNTGRFFFVYTIKDPGVRDSREKQYVRTKEGSFGPVVFYGSPEYRHDYNSFSFNFWLEEDELTSSEHSRIMYRRVNEKTYGPFTGNSKIQFSLDGSRYIFNYTRGNRDYVQTDGKAYGPYAKVYECRISADGKKHAFTYYKGGRDYIKIGDRVHGPLGEAPRFLEITDINYTISPFMPAGSPLVAWGSGRIFYVEGIVEQADRPYDVTAGVRGGYGFRVILNVYNKDAKYCALVNDRLYGPCEEIDGPYIDKEGGGYIFGQRTGKRAFCDVNGKKFGPYENVFEMGMKGRDYWFHYHRAGRHLMINGKSYGMLEYSWEPVFEPGSGNYAFLCRIGPDYYVQMKDRRLGPFRIDERKREELLYQPRVIKDGIAVRYRRNGDEYIFYRGRDNGPFTWGDIVKAEDGKPYLVTIREGHVIVEGAE